MKSWQKGWACGRVLGAWAGLGMFANVTAQVAVRPQFETATQTANAAATSVDRPANQPVQWINDANLTTANDDVGEQWILQPNEKPKAFRASVDLSAVHTSNVALTSRNALDDNYFLGQIAVGWQRPLGHGLTLDLDLQQAFFRYNDFSVLNFDSLNLGAGLSGPMPFLANSSWSARYNFNRLTAENFGSELYTSHSLQLGAQKVFQLARADSLFLGVSAQVNFADPSDLERREYTVYGGYALAVTRSITCDATYRAAAYDYSETGRTDFNQSLSVGLHWRPWEIVTVSGSASGALNRSDESTFDYDLLNAGVSLSAVVQF